MSNTAITNQPFNPLRNAHIVALVLLVLLIGFEYMEWDQPLALALIQDGRFPLRNHVLLEKWLHDGIKPVIWAMFIALCSQLVRPWGWLADVPRGRLAFAVLSMVVCVLLVVAIKRVSPVSCPWDLREAGGAAVYVEHWFPWNPVSQVDGGAGRCFPGGHSNYGFVWIALFFALHDIAPKRARIALVFALSFGMLLGTVQQFRGAHYFSHSPTTGLLCWYVCTLLWSLWPRRYKGALKKS